jgi:hypothetical protein
MAHKSGEIVNLTIRVDSGVLMLAKHRALLERVLRSSKAHPRPT